MPKTGFFSPKTLFKSPKIMFLANLKHFWRSFWRIIYKGWIMKKKSYKGTRCEKRGVNKCVDGEYELGEFLNYSMWIYDLCFFDMKRKSAFI